MLASEPGPAAQSPGPAAQPAAPVARAVADDLEAIFAEPSVAGGSVRRKLRLRAVARAAVAGRGPRERRWASVGALAAATCVGLSAGALFAPRHAPQPTVQPPARAGAPVMVESVALPEPGPLPTAQLAVSLPPDALPPLAPAAQPVARPVNLVHDTGAKPVKHKPAPAHAAKCAGKSACGPTALKTADARLRHAYASAERAGVSNAVLADYRDEWSQLRRHAPERPTAVATRYRQMAAELSRLAAHQRVARAQPPPPPQPGPWKRFRMELASLWR